MRSTQAPMTPTRYVLLIGLAVFMMLTISDSNAQLDSSVAVAADPTGPTQGADPGVGSAAATDPAGDQSTKAAGTITVTSDPLVLARAVVNPKDFDLVTTGTSSPK
jgi:hypothetical protein